MERFGVTNDFRMNLITILKRCDRLPGFVYRKTRFSDDRRQIEVTVEPRRGAKLICSGCQQPAPGYDRLSQRRFEFIPLWGFLVFLLYTMRRVNCPRCGVKVEQVPWADGTHHLTKTEDRSSRGGIARLVQSRNS